MFYSHHTAAAFVSAMEAHAVAFERKLYDLYSTVGASRPHQKRAFVIYNSARDNLHYSAERARLYLSGNKPEGVASPAALEEHMATILQTSSADLGNVIEESFAAVAA